MDDKGNDKEVLFAGVCSCKIIRVPLNPVLKPFSSNPYRTVTDPGVDPSELPIPSDVYLRPW